MLSGATRDKKAATLGQAARSMHGVESGTAIKWREQEMASYRAQCLLSLADSHTVCISFDAARIGRPALDLLAVVLTDPVKQRSFVLPPQALAMWPETPVRTAPRTSSSSPPPSTEVPPRAELSHMFSDMSGLFHLLVSSSLGTVKMGSFRRCSLSAPPFSLARHLSRRQKPSPGKHAETRVF